MNNQTVLIIVLYSIACAAFCTLVLANIGIAATISTMALSVAGMVALVRFILPRR